ncbi:putative mediator of RNA polymerase II transcription subunit 26 [Rhopalosiphum maidis]|uniref:putative mediator of RNA polymerase II transcription subunit 26 n=1 Tax=Rhopalosiphum maidis TaxID=43146 RepID=UPI000EFFD4CA|nr:putative mediator of RNA polymerase II transcription subunit 26 [Rhopalosiphum maidis]
MAGPKQLLQVCLLITFTVSALCLRNVDQTRLIADRPKHQKPTSWDQNSNLWKNKQGSVPPYAVKMEPMVHYSQQDPLYLNANHSATAKIDFNSHASGSEFGISSNYGPPNAVYGVPYQPDYYKEPEPIIEIIIKESNESLPAPPTPPPVPTAKPQKEPVQVFYVKYKKNPNSYGDKEDIIYEAPVPAITPSTEAVSESETVISTESSPLYNYVTGPPAPSTTYRTIIKPDSEIYHGTGLKVTFGKTESDWSPSINEAQKRDSISEASEIQNKVKKSTEQEFKRSFVQPTPDYQRSNNNFETPHITNQPQFNGFNTPKPNIDHTQQQLRKPSQSVQNYFREDNPRPNFQAQIPIINQQFKPQQNNFEGIVEQRPIEYKENFRTQQNFQQSNNQPNFQQFTNQQNHQQFINSPNHQQPNNLQYHQQPNNLQHHQQHHQQLNNPQNQPNHQQFNNPQNQPNHQQFNNPQNQPNHQQFNNHQNHQQINNQQNRPPLINQQNHQQFINQPRLPTDFQPNPPLRNPGNFQERPVQIKTNERPFINKPFESRPPLSKPFESRPFDSKPFESRPIQDNHFDNRPIFDRPFENNRPIQNRPYENRQNQGIVNYRPNKPPTPHNIPLNPNPSFIPVDKRPTNPLPPQPSNFNTHPTGTKHSVDLAFSPQLQQQQHQQFQQQQFQQQQLQQQQIRPAETRPLVNNNPTSFQQQPIIKQQQFSQEIKPSQIAQYQTAKQQQFIPELKPSEIPQLQITPSQSYEIDPKQLQQPAQSGQFIETYNRYQPSTQTEQNYYRPDNTPWQVSNQQQSSFKVQQQEYQEQSSPSTIKNTIVTTSKSILKTTEKPASFVTTQYKERSTPVVTVATPKSTTTEAAKNETKKQDLKNIASLPDEVPDELREQLLSSGILGNADIQILDYDKVGDIPIENLPPEALENLYGQGSAPVPSVVLPPNKSNVQMKVVKYDPSTEEGRKIENTYIDRPKSQTLDPVVLNDTGYNRFLPLNINGTHFPIPDSPLLKNKSIGSVVILSPVGYDLSDDQSRSSRNTAVKVKGVHFVVGDIVKNLVKDPNRENFKTWLEKEKSTPSDEQSVVLLVTKPNGKENRKEIYMYDVTHNQVNKLSGELSATFVDVAESNAQSHDLDNLSTEEEVDVSGNSTTDNIPIVSGYSKTNDFSGSIVANANN